MTTPETRQRSSSWDAKLQRRHGFCKRFVREHHPGMADAHKIKGARPLKPFDGPRYLRDGNGDMAVDWWLQTDDSVSALGLVWLAHLFGRQKLYDHAWMIGRSDQEAWALVSEPYSHVTAATIAKLRRELERRLARSRDRRRVQMPDGCAWSVAVAVAPYVRRYRSAAPRPERQRAVAADA